VERRAGAKGNTHQQSTCRAQNRASVSQALARIRQLVPSHTRGRSRMRESRTYGSGRGRGANMGASGGHQRRLGISPSSSKPVRTKPPRTGNEICSRSGLERRAKLTWADVVEPVLGADPTATNVVQLLRFQFPARCKGGFIAAHHRAPVFNVAPALVPLLSRESLELGSVPQGTVSRPIREHVWSPPKVRNKRWRHSTRSRWDAALAVSETNISPCRPPVFFAPLPP
jgi:hypothetical protein